MWSIDSVVKETTPLISWRRDAFTAMPVNGEYPS